MEKGKKVKVWINGECISGDPLIELPEPHWISYTLDGEWRVWMTVRIISPISGRTMELTLDDSSSSFDYIKHLADSRVPYSPGIIKINGFDLDTVSQPELTRISK